MLWLGLLVTYHLPKPQSDREIAMARRIAELERLNRALILALTKINEGE